MINDNKNMTEIVIVGASGFGREILWTIHDCNKQSKQFKILGFVDDNKDFWDKTVNGVTVLGGLEWFSSNYNRDVECIISVADPQIRQKIAKKLESYNVKFSTIIHPSVILSERVSFGKGTVVQAGSILTTEIKIGNHVHVNIDSTIGHDCIVKDFVTISPGVHINGRNIVETGSFFGAGVVTKERIRVGEWSVIGAGTVLLENVQARSLYTGIPGKLKKRFL